VVVIDVVVLKLVLCKLENCFFSRKRVLSVFSGSGIPKNREVGEKRMLA